MAATENDLKESQAKLDAIEEKIVENKQARLELREEAKVLRDEYLAEEKIRESLLKEVLTAKEGEE
jgi:hypothetical protein